MTVTYAHFTPSWPDATYTESQLYSFCGEPNYYLHSDMAENSTYDNIFTSFSYGSRLATPPGNVITL